MVALPTFVNQEESVFIRLPSTASNKTGNGSNPTRHIEFGMLFIWRSGKVMV